MKDAFYFGHDSNARHDPKLIAFIEEYGIAGHAYFFILIEILREQKNYIFPTYLVNALAKEWQTHGTAIAPQNILDSMVKLQLIAVNEEGYYSPSLCQRMEYFEDIKKKRSDAGKAGAKALWQTHGKRMAKDGKERKEKKRKETTTEGLKTPSHTALKHKKGQDAYDMFRSKYKEVVGTEYIAQWGKDMKSLNPVLPHIKSSDHWSRILDAYFNDSFAQTTKFTFGVLISQINKYNKESHDNIPAS